MRRAVLMTRQAISPRLAIRIFLNIIGLSSDHATLAMARFLWYIDRVIVSFANRATERFAREGKAKFAGLDAGKAMARLQLLHAAERSEEHTSELQSLMRISYAVFCLKKKQQHK